MNYYVTDNTGASVALNDIPEVSYAAFYEDLRVKLSDARYHAAHYFALPSGDRMRFFLLLLDDAERRVLITSHATDYYDETALPSLTALHPQMHPFERDISERYGIRFDGMPWPKPLRFPAGRYDRRSSIENYPFYTMEGRSLHEVNVGPIHAGVIEPGAFRFICNGEQVLHLEIALGYQHRDVETAFETTANRLRQMCLAESVAGDSAVAHATAFARAVEKLARRYDQVRRDIKSSPSLLARFEQCGIVPRDEMQRIGGVGQAARASGLARDIRTSHPWGVFAGALRHESIVKTHGDVMARLMVRCREVLQSAGYIDRLLDLHGQECGNAGHPRPDYAAPLAPSSLAFGLVEGWRGETCHVLLTDAEGRIAAVRIKDPSLHNWLALALAVRGEGISDFPICNKSFNLSYCGHDL